jgi:hypothetical protein
MNIEKLKNALYEAANELENNEYSILPAELRKLAEELESEQQAEPVAWMYENNKGEKYLDIRPYNSFAMPLYTAPPAHSSEVVKELCEECFQHVFKIYSTPRDKFIDDEQWGLFCYRQVYDNLEKFQRLRTALAKHGNKL